ncbi:MAG TPA: alpha/beta fold hydrolase [Candidatus Sulfomarinibacteraceae bacterium]|nr:alpha/beta fold hydrolase [Candidatus Sulfomarinibacteraceae bacterium]
MPFTPQYNVPEERRAYSLRCESSIGCLMLHGFIGSPVSSRPMAEYLSQRGINVHCPLLPGHGQLPDKMQGIEHRAWLAEAEEALEELRCRCDDIFLMGHSMGAVLCAHLATQNADVRGLILLAPLYKPPSRFISLLRVLRYVMPWLYPWRIGKLRPLARSRILDLYPALDLEDPEVQAWLPRATRMPTAAIDEMRKMADLGRLFWPQLTQPALVFQGERDIAVKPGNTEKVVELLGSSEKKLHKFPRAGHELMRPLDPVHEEVWALVYDFICRHATVEATTAAATSG